MSLCAPAQDWKGRCSGFGIGIALFHRPILRDLRRRHRPVEVAVYQFDFASLSTTLKELPWSPTPISKPPSKRIAHAIPHRRSTISCPEPLASVHAEIQTQAGVSSDFAFPTTFSVIPEPGEATTSFGRRSSSSLLRWNGAARSRQFQSGLHTT